MKLNEKRMDMVLAKKDVEKMDREGLKEISLYKPRETRRHKHSNEKREQRRIDSKIKIEITRFYL